MASLNKVYNTVGGAVLAGLLTVGPAQDADAALMITADGSDNFKLTSLSEVSGNKIAFDTLGQYNLEPPISASLSLDTGVYGLNGGAAFIVDQTSNADLLQILYLFDDTAEIGGKSLDRLVVTFGGDIGGSPDVLSSNELGPALAAASNGQFLNGGGYIVHFDDNDVAPLTGEIDDFSAKITNVPVPGTLALTGLGLAALARTRRDGVSTQKVGGPAPVVV